MITLVLKHLHLMHNAFNVSVSVWKGDLSIASHLGLATKAILVKPLVLVYWKKPPLEWVKFNTDGTFCASNALAASAGVVRCSEGRVLKCFQHYLGKRSIQYAELFSILTGIKVCKEMGITKILVESDAFNITEALNHSSNSNCWTLLHLYLFVQELAKDTNVRYTHILREGNSVADALAKDSLKKKCTTVFSIVECTS